MLKVTAAIAALVGLPFTFVVMGSDEGRALATPLCTLVASTAAPSASAAPSTVTAANLGLTDEQLSNAATIVHVGEVTNVPATGWMKAIATAYVESGLRNLSYGDRDSLGLFQQRPSQGWGDPTQLLDPQYAATKFYEHLIALPDWQTTAPGVAEQQVQRSAYPDRYAPAETIAQTIVAAVGGAVCQGGMAATGDTAGAAAYNRAITQLGVPYSWGGGNATGPSYGIAQGAGINGFDCSGLVLFAYAPSGLTLSHLARSQATYGRHVDVAELQAGDLLFFNTDGPQSHVGIADGHGGMVHAPRTGRNVEVVTSVLTQPYWNSRFEFATRPVG